MATSHKETHYCQYYQVSPVPRVFYHFISVFTRSLYGTWFSGELGRFAIASVCYLILSPGPWGDIIQPQWLTDEVRNGVPSIPSILFIITIYATKQKHLVFAFPISTNMYLFWNKNHKSYICDRHLQNECILSLDILMRNLRKIICRNVTIIRVHHYISQRRK